MKRSLEEKQNAMKLRWSWKRVPGPKTGSRRKKRPTVVDREKVKKRLAALILLRRGNWTVERVAAQLKVYPELVRSWLLKGCPMLPKKPKTEKLALRALRVGGHTRLIPRKDYL